jgi:MFS family permease
VQFRLLFAGLLASNIGLWFQEFAIGWLVVQLAVRDGNPALAGLYLGLKSLATAVPAISVGVFAGVYADRMDRRMLLTRARVASATIAIVLASLVVTDRANIVTVMILSAASSATFAFDPPGRQAMLATVLPARDLFSGMGLTRGSMQVARMIGPVIASVLMVPAGIGGVLLAKAGLDVASVSMMLRMAPQPAEAKSRAIGVLASLREGLDHIVKDERIRWCAVLQLLFAILAVPFSQLLPAVAFETLHGGAQELAWLVAATGIGALIGAGAVTGSGAVERRGIVLLASMLLTGALLIVLGMQRSLAGMLVVLVGLAALQQVFMGTQAVVLQLAAPDRLRGRMSSVQSVIFMGCAPIGVLAVGSLGTVVGVSTALLLAGVVVTVVSVVAITRVSVIRELRASDDLAIGRPAMLAAQGEGLD